MPDTIAYLATERKRQEDEHAAITQMQMLKAREQELITEMKRIADMIEIVEATRAPIPGFKLNKPYA